MAGAHAGDVHENKLKYLSLSIWVSGIPPKMSHFCVIMNVPTPTHSYAGCHSSFYQFCAEKDSQKKTSLFFYFPITFQTVSFLIVAGETGEKMLKNVLERLVSDQEYWQHRWWQCWWGLRVCVCCWLIALLKLFVLLAFCKSLKQQSVWTYQAIKYFTPPWSSLLTQNNQKAHKHIKINSPIKKNNNDQTIHKACKCNIKHN